MQRNTQASVTRFYLPYPFALAIDHPPHNLLARSIPPDDLESEDCIQNTLLEACLVSYNKITYKTSNRKVFIDIYFVLRFIFVVILIHYRCRANITFYTTYHSIIYL